MEQRADTFGSCECASLDNGLLHKLGRDLIVTGDDLEDVRVELVIAELQCQAM